jgi:hypothetical protein
MEERRRLGWSGIYAKLFGTMGKAFSAASSPEPEPLARATDEAGFVVGGGVG